MDRLKILRAEKGLAQKDMASFLKIDRTTYVKYESGSSEPNFSTLSKLAEFFDVSVDYLLGRTDIRQLDNKNQPTVKDDELDEALVKFLSGLSPEEVQRVRDFVAGLKAARTEGASRQE